MTEDQIESNVSEMLFDGYPDPERPEPGPPALTNHDKRRRTIDNRRARQKDAIEKGVHPLNGRQLARNGHTCGDCNHRILKTMSKSYPKCELGPMTGGPGTDVLASWPACILWEDRGDQPVHKVWVKH